jgi:hypothetical protein
VQLQQPGFPAEVQILVNDFFLFLLYSHRCTNEGGNAVQIVVINVEAIGSKKTVKTVKNKCRATQATAPVFIVEGD